MTQPSQPTRRVVLTASAAGAGALALAACSPSSSQPSQPPRAAAGERLTTVAAVGVGASKSATLKDGSPVVVSRPTASTVACFSAICTHAGCTVQPAGNQLQCPCHGSVYDAFTGAVIRGVMSGQAPLQRIPVHVSAGAVVTGAAAG
jgi:Rieske Fe-S protein